MGDQAPRELRFSDVIDELGAAASLADEGRGTDVALACRRLEDLLDRLRSQFLADLGLSIPDR